MRVAKIRTYAAANTYLRDTFVPDFNRRFTVKPAQRESAFVPLRGLNLRLVLSSHHPRQVQNDHTVHFAGRLLQLPRSPVRPHFVRCRVLVHEFPDATLGISFQGQLLAAYSRGGERLTPAAAGERAA